MSNAKCPISNEKGVSLVELLLVIVLIGAMVFLMANLPNAMNLINKAKHTSLAREIAVKQIDDKRNISFTNLVNGQTQITDSRISLLPSGTGTTVISDCNSQVCTNGEHVKQATVTITWQDNNKPQILIINTLIGEGGLNQ